MLNITVINRNTSEKKRYKFTQNAILIGRQSNCDIMLESNTVSRKHARILVTKNLIEVEDLGSGNGTLINQEKIKNNDKALIKPGDKIRIEEFDIEIDQKDMSDIASISHQSRVDVTDPDILEIKMIKKVLGALDHDKIPSLTVVSSEFKGTKSLFKDGMEQLVIGRDDDCDLTINASVVSRKHAVITLKWGGFVITDSDSKNGTFVNGERVTEKAIKDGDEIVFGTIRTLFKNPQEFDIAAITKSIEEQKERKKKEEAEQAQKETVEEKPVEQTPKKPEPTTTDQPPTKQNLPQPVPQKQKPKLMTNLSLTEKLLFGFGLAVIVTVLIVLFSLLQG